MSLFIIRDARGHFMSQSPSSQGRSRFSAEYPDAITFNSEGAARAVVARSLRAGLVIVENYGLGRERSIRIEPAAGMKLTLNFGAICPPIAEQLVEQGLTADSSDLSNWQRDADAVVLLRIHALLPDSEAHKIHQRLLKKICKAVTPNQAAAGADKKESITKAKL